MRGPSTPRPARPMTTTAYPEVVTYDDLAQIGAALLTAGAAMTTMGHESPEGLSCYVSREDMPTWHAQFVLDMVAISQSVTHDEMKEAALDRISGLAWQSGAAALAAEVTAAVVS